MIIERTELIQSLFNYNIPEHLHEGLIAYVLDGRETGRFLQSVIENNLREAVGRADHESEEALTRLVKWFYNKAPSSCWGTRDSFGEWILAGGFNGLANKRGVRQ